LNVAVDRERGRPNRRDLLIDPVRDVELRARLRDGEAAGDAPHQDGLREHPERAIDDGDGARILEGDVEPPRVRSVPQGAARPRADRDDALYDAGSGVDESDRSSGAIDGSEPDTVGAKRDAAYVLPHGNLRDDPLRAMVDTHEADRADVAVRGPDEAATCVEDDRRRGGVLSACDRDFGGGGALERWQWRAVRFRHASVGGRSSVGVRA